MTHFRHSRLMDNTSNHIDASRIAIERHALRLSKSTLVTTFVERRSFREVEQEMVEVQGCCTCCFAHVHKLFECNWICCLRVRSSAFNEILTNSAWPRDRLSTPNPVTAYLNPCRPTTLADVAAAAVSSLRTVTNCTILRRHH